MGSGKKPKLPIKKSFRRVDANGDGYLVEVSVEETNDSVSYPPDGIKSVYKVFKLNGEGEKELVILIDNHEPFGFHEHTDLPNKEPREEIHTSDWMEAWSIFEERIGRMFL